MITKAQFTKMNKMRRRVALAKDVIQQIAAKKFILRERKCYFTTSSFVGQNKMGDKKFTQRYLNDKSNQCYVCAKGALFCSYVRQFDGHNMYDLQSSADNAEMIKIFGQNLWDAIESYYEGWTFWLGNQKIPVYNNHDMEDLMANIIKNKGKLIMDGNIFE